MGEANMADDVNKFDENKMPSISGNKKSYTKPYITSK